MFLALPLSPFIAKKKKKNYFIQLIYSDMIDVMGVAVEIADEGKRDGLVEVGWQVLFLGCEGRQPVMVFWSQRLLSAVTGKFV